MTTPNLALPYLAAAQAQKHVTVNEALDALDGLVQLSVISAALAAPPGKPGRGQSLRRRKRCHWSMDRMGRQRGSVFWRRVAPADSANGMARMGCSKRPASGLDRQCMDRAGCGYEASDPRSFGSGGASASWSRNRHGRR